VIVLQVPRRHHWTLVWSDLDLSRLPSTFGAVVLGDGQAQVAAAGALAADLADEPARANL